MMGRCYAWDFISLRNNMTRLSYPGNMGLMILLYFTVYSLGIVYSAIEGRNTPRFSSFLVYLTYILYQVKHHKTLEAEAKQIEY